MPFPLVRSLRLENDAPRFWRWLTLSPSAAQRGLLVLRYGPLVLWITIALIGGTALGRYEHSWNLITWSLNRLCPELAISDAPQIVSMYQLNTAFRRLAHVLVYAVLTLTFVRAFQGRRERLRPGALLSAFVVCLLFTLVEGWVRTRSEARHFHNDHFLLNGIGILLALLGVVFHFGIRSLEARLTEIVEGESDAE